MAIIDPVVRHMIACEDVIASKSDPSKISLVYLLSTIPAVLFPYELPKFCVFLRIAGGRGIGSGRIVVVQASTAHLSSRHANIQYGIHPIH